MVLPQRIAATHIVGDANVDEGRQRRFGIANADGEPPTQLVDAEAAWLGRERRRRWRRAGAWFYKGFSRPGRHNVVFVGRRGDREEVDSDGRIGLLLGLIDDSKQL